MKADEDVKMISAEAPVLFAKACEMFIIELTHRSYYHTLENKRKTLQRSDISQTIASTDIYDFLQDIIPKEELREAQASAKKLNQESMLEKPAQNDIVLPNINQGSIEATPNQPLMSQLQDLNQPSVSETPVNNFIDTKALTAPNLLTEMDPDKIDKPEENQDHEIKEN